jgi:hypothetical protein
MKILAASVQVQQIADTFLHAGYGSAFPRTLITYGRGWSRELPLDAQPRMKLELTEALRLEGGEGVASALTSGQPGEGAGPALGLLGSSLGQLLLVVTAFFAGLALFYLLRNHRHRLARLHPRAIAAALALLAAPLLSGAADPGPPGPRYQDPALATRALMQMVIADALANTGETRKGVHARLELASLDPIKPEVGLPTRQLTAGMKHALQDYRLDGWGRPFRLRGNWRYGFIVTSAGADGAFKTRDDLWTRIHPDHAYAWESRRRAFFLRKVDGELVLLFHRSKMRTFRFNDRARARALTGTGLFDAIPVSKLSKKDRRRMRRIYKAMAGDSGQALVALAFRSRS